MTNTKSALALLVLFAWNSGKQERLWAEYNVLFLVADDLNCAISPYGDSTAVTPNLARLASRGLTFERAYCQQAVCNPSRSSFLTGLRPDRVGVDDLRKYFRETSQYGVDLVTLPQHFKNHGYFCQDIGKIFHNMGETQDRQSWSIDETFYKGPHSSDTVFFNQPQLANSPKRPFKAPVSESLEIADTVYRDGQISRLAASVLTDRAESVRLQSNRNVGGGKERNVENEPFFLAVGFWRPHLPFVAPKRYWDLYRPAQIALPTPPDAPTDVPDIAMHDSREIRGYGHVPKEREWTEKEIRHFRHGYYAAISFLDAQVGVILDALDASGLADSTIIVFTSDHGFHVGEQTLWGKTSNFELDARVPLIISSPGHPQSQGASTDSLVELIDLFPTLTDLAEIQSEPTYQLDGTSLKPILEDQDAEVKSAALTQHQHPFYGKADNWRAWGRSMRTRRWRYTEWRSLTNERLIARELYDHLGDPHETKNVANDPSHVKTIKNLASQLEALRSEPN